MNLDVANASAQLRRGLAYLGLSSAPLCHLKWSFQSGRLSQSDNTDWHGMRWLPKMRWLPRHYSQFAYGIIQSAITTGVATAIATHQAMGFSASFVPSWGLTWGLAWLTMLPVVVGISPLIKRAVEAMTIAEGG